MHTPKGSTATFLMFINAGLNKATAYSRLTFKSKLFNLNAICDAGLILTHLPVAPADRTSRPPLLGDLIRRALESTQWLLVYGSSPRRD